MKFNNNAWQKGDTFKYTISGDKVDFVGDSLTNIEYNNELKVELKVLAIEPDSSILSWTRSCEERIPDSLLDDFKVAISDTVEEVVQFSIEYSVKNGGNFSSILNWDELKPYYRQKWYDRFANVDSLERPKLNSVLNDVQEKSGDYSFFLPYHPNNIALLHLVYKIKETINDSVGKLKCQACKGDSMTYRILYSRGDNCYVNIVYEFNPSYIQNNIHSFIEYMSYQNGQNPLSVRTKDSIIINFKSKIDMPYFIEHYKTIMVNEKLNQTFNLIKLMEVNGEKTSANWRND